MASAWEVGSWQMASWQVTVPVRHMQRASTLQWMVALEKWPSWGRSATKPARLQCFSVRTVGVASTGLRGISQR